MDIAVCVKLTYDVQEIRADGNGAPVFQNVPIKISEFDKYAIEAGVKLKEGSGGVVRMFSVANPNAKEAIKEALARGCDEGYIIAYDYPPQDPAMVSKLLASAIRIHAPQSQIIFAGEASSDMSSSVTGAMVAAWLGIPFIGYASKVQVQGDSVMIERDGDNVIEGFVCKPPVVIGTSDRLNKPRTPTLTQILSAGRKPVKILSPDNVDPEAAPLSKMEKVDVFRMERKRVLIDGSDPVSSAEKLISELRREGVL